MNSEKKILALILVFTFILMTLTGCSGGSSSPNQSDESTVGIPITKTETQNEEAAQRKERSMAIIEDKGIYVMEGLPTIETESDCIFQTTEDIAKRSVALMILALYSESMLNPEIGDTVAEAREYVQVIIDQYGANDFFSPDELNYLENENPTELEIINYTWQYENLGVMLWSLGMMDELPFPNSIIDVPLSVQRMIEFKTIDEMVAAAKPKTHSEILDAADLIFRLDWACVEARINGENAPAGLDSGVVMERHKSLNWLIRSGENWDEIDIST